MPQYKLQYFDARGLAEPARFLFALASVDYEDARFPFSFGTPGDFSTIKREEFDAAKAAGELDESMGKVPYLQVDGGAKVGQSKAIERFLAGEFGLAGGSALERAQVDAVCETIRDITDAVQKEKAKPDGDAAKWIATALPDTLALLEKSLGAGGEFLVGAGATLADVHLFLLLGDAEGGLVKQYNAAVPEHCTRLAASIRAFAALPQVQGWLEKRPKTAF